MITHRLYERAETCGPSAVVRPSQRLTCSVQDLLVTFGRITNNYHNFNRNNERRNQLHRKGRQSERGRRRKVLGIWNSSEKPRDILLPMFQLFLVGYNVDNGNLHLQPSDGQEMDENGPKQSSEMEYRLSVRLLPIRCYLDDYIVNFCKRLIPKTVKSASQVTVTDDKKQKRNESGQADLVYFQSITLASTDIKIDYRASAVNLRSLQAGKSLFRIFCTNI